MIAPVRLCSRYLGRRVVVIPQQGKTNFSTRCEPAQRLRDVMTEYRRENYSMEVPSRFKKEVLLPYTEHDGTVEIESVNRLLKNIGHSGDCFSDEEQQQLLAEAGSKGNRSIPVSKMMELIG